MAPGLGVLAGYRRRWLRGDLVAGITVAAYLVPQVMAYATVAGLQPAAGLWATVPALAVYAVSGSSRLLWGCSCSEDFRHRALAAVDGNDGPVAWFVLNTEANIEVDITALDAFGLTATIGADRIFPTLPTAIA